MAIFRRPFLLSFSFLFVIFGIISLNAAELPSFNLRDYKTNKQVSFENVKGEGLTLINFWATWCVACVKELPELEALKVKYPKAHFLAINAGESTSKIKKFLRKHTFSYQILLDQEKVYSKGVDVLELPHTMVVDQNRKVLYRSHQPPKELKFE